MSESLLTTATASSLSQGLHLHETLTSDQTYFVTKAQRIGKHVELEPEAVAQFFGVASELAEGAVNDAEIIAPHIRIAHRMSAGSFEKFLVDGRLKGFVETGHSGGAARKINGAGDHHTYIRKKYESDKGLRGEGEPELIHGFLEDTTTLGERAIAFMYGPVEVVLKPEVMDRTVYTFGDSGLTQLAPYDTESAIVGEQVRNRSHQRTRDSRYGDMYTEAIVLGGVGIEDVESIIISMGDQQGGQRSSEKSGPKDVAELTDWILSVREIMPDVSLAVRIPAETYFPSKGILELAEKYPDIQFLGTIRDNDDLGVESPFRSVPTDESIYAMGDDIGAIDDIRERSQYSYDKATERRQFLGNKLVERSQKSGHGQALPNNISLHITNKRY